MNINDVHVPRQQVIRGAGLVLTAGALAACGDGGDKPAEQPAASSEAVTTPPAAETSGGAIAKTADVPVGSGVIVDDIVEFGLTYAATVREDHRHFVEAFREGRIRGVSSA